MTTIHLQACSAFSTNKATLAVPIYIMKVWGDLITNTQNKDPRWRAMRSGAPHVRKAWGAYTETIRRPRVSLSQSGNLANIVKTS
jgi:hypothetical protein